MKNFIILAAFLIAAFQLKAITPDGAKKQSGSKDGYFKAAILCTPEMRVTSPASPGTDGKFTVDLGSFFKGFEQDISSPEKQITFTLTGPVTKSNGTPIDYIVNSSVEPPFTANGLRPAISAKWQTWDNYNGEAINSTGDFKDKLIQLIPISSVDNCKGYAIFKIIAYHIDCKGKNILLQEHVFKVSVTVTANI